LLLSLSDGTGAALLMPAHPERLPSWTRILTSPIRADRATVFHLLAEVELWPALFPHVRSARVLRRDGRRRLFVVRATWRGLPLGYRAIETVDPEPGIVTIRHLSRLTRGSVATWAVRSMFDANGTANGVDVSVDQRVIVQFPVIGGLLARELIGGRVARDLGEAMLQRLKEVAEGGSLADQR
jgi:hypothetical protein